MNIRIAFPAIALTLLLCLNGSAQTLQPRIQQSNDDSRIAAAWKGASNVLAAFRSGDFEAYANLTHRSIIENQGGRESMIAMSKQAKLTLEQQTDGFDSTVDKPTRIIGATRTVYTVVPQNVSIRLKAGQEFNRQSYLLGISEDQGRSWKFIDGSNGAAKIRELVPDFPENEPLPDEKNR